MSIIQLALLFPLAIFSILDIKYKEIPSILPTSCLFVFASLNINNMPFGILAFIFAYFLYEFDFFGGVADIKLLTTIGFMLNSLTLLMILAFLTPIIGAIYKFIIKKYTKKKKWAFIPCITLIYLVLLLFM